MGQRYSWLAITSGAGQGTAEPLLGQTGEYYTANAEQQSHDSQASLHAGYATNMKRWMHEGSAGLKPTQR